jgi:hypothetical protein
MRGSRTRPHSIPCDDQESIELMSVLSENVVESGQLEREIGGLAKSKEDDPAVRFVQPDDHLAEVAIVGDEDSFFAEGDGEHISVRQSTWDVTPDALRVVAELKEVRQETRIGALVQQEAQDGHLWAWTGSARAVRVRVPRRTTASCA